MAPREHHRAQCPSCGAELVFLAGDPSVGYEDILPLDQDQRTLVEHTDQRCAFHRFLTPDPAHHVLPGNANWLDKTLATPQQSARRYQRWVRTDDHSD